MLITHTKPVFTSTREDGMKGYEFTLSNPMNVTCTTFRCNIKDAITYAKKLIQAYTKRRELESRLSEQDKYTTPNAVPANLESGWVGINWDAQRARWRVIVRFNKKDINIGSYKAASAAISAKKKANIKHGLPEFQGRK